MTEETVHETEKRRSRHGIATFFRRIARRLGNGEKVPVNDEQTVAIDPPDEAELEVEIEREAGELSLEIEMDWPEEAGPVDTDADTSKATFQLYEDTAGEYRWRLRHDNGEIIADSAQGYSSKQKAKQGMNSVKTNAPAAAVEETDG